VADAAVKGVIIASAKTDFIAGADLNMMLAITDVQGLMDFVARLHTLLRGIEKSGKPFVAALNGTTLGGGYRSRWPATAALRPTTPRPRSACPKWPSACYRGAAARSACRA